MGYYQIKKKQIIKTDIDTLWSFVSRPKNLNKITPSDIGFQIINQSSEKMEEGMIITYKIIPFFNIKTSWITEISHVSKNKKFIDHQLHGPYKFWHHQHIFKVINSESTEMIDIITYMPPFGVLGDLVNAFFIKKKLKNIFDYREEILNNFFQGK